MALKATHPNHCSFFFFFFLNLFRRWEMMNACYFYIRDRNFLLGLIRKHKNWVSLCGTSSAPGSWAPRQAQCWGRAQRSAGAQAIDFIKKPASRTLARVSLELWLSSWFQQRHPKWPPGCPSVSQSHVSKEIRINNTGKKEIRWGRGNSWRGIQDSPFRGQARSTSF